MFPDRIETNRLLLERLSRETVDIFELYRVCSHHDPNIEEVTRDLSWSHTRRRRRRSISSRPLRPSGTTARPRVTSFGPWKARTVLARLRVGRR